MIIKRNNAFTMVELLVVILALSIILGVISSSYITGLRLWNSGFSRSSMRTKLAQSLELISKNLRQAKSIDALTESSITFTADLGNGDQSYRVYLYNSADAEPNPPYTQEFYFLYWVSDDITYGLGATLATNILQPTSVVFSQSNNVITIDLEAQEGDQIVGMSTKVRPRNL
ncbi:MAG: type II secretion system protein [Candidatus Zapsychrus exili]|nr:type II secretion system protein [Candidatus Zapsychrus exili]